MTERGDARINPEFKKTSEYKLASEEQLRNFEVLARQFGFLETDDMESLRTAEKRYSPEEFSSVVGEWQRLAHIAAEKIMLEGVRDAARQLKIDVGWKLLLLNFALRQGSEAYADDLCSDLDYMIEEDLHGSGALRDVVSLIDEVILSLDTQRS